MQTALTIAGFDPSSGAGVTADLKVFAAHGLFGTSCITALTVQSTRGVMSTHPVDPAIIRETLECLDADLPPFGIKIGMLLKANNINEISRYCRTVKAKDTENGQTPIVLDPLIRSSSGRELIDPAGLLALREHLLPAVDWITPNLDELAALSGQTIRASNEIPRSCQVLQEAIGLSEVSGRCIGIIATGGHLSEPDDYILTPDGEEFWLPGTRIETTATHGTGCAFSSAFLSRLVLGDMPYQAAIAAKSYVVGALRSTIKIGTGIGPVNHLWNTTNVRDEE